MPAPLLVVDAPSLLYRAWFALPDSITGADGMPVNALLGATNAILRVVADRGPRAVVICSGAEAARYRVERYPPATTPTRPPVPDGLALQIARSPAAVRGARLDARGHAGAGGRRPAALVSRWRRPRRAARRC